MIPLAPIVTLIISRIIDYIANNPDEIISAVKEQFPSLADNSGFQVALQELGYDPTEDKLNVLHDMLDAKGENPAFLAQVLVNKTIS